MKWNGFVDRAKERLLWVWYNLAFEDRWLWTLLFWAGLLYAVVLTWGSG